MTAGRRGLGWRDVAVLAALTVLPQLLTGRGRLNADTKQHLYLDPLDLLDRARVIWDSRIGGGTVTHQAIGYLWPMGPFYALTDALGVPDWASQRLWIGGLQLLAALGALALFRHLLPRSWVQVPAAAMYGLSPFVLGLATTQSGLLVPWAGLGWLILIMVRAVESPRSWRWPAAFALVVTTCGSLNGSSVFFVVVAAALWVPFALAGTGRGGLRTGVSVLARAGALTLATQLWWIVAYAVGGGYGLPVLDITETVSTTNATSSAPEALRGLGYWTFYGVDSAGPWLRGLADHYQTSVGLLVVSFAIPVVALWLGAAVRWTARAYFGTLIGLGVVLSVGAFPVGDPSPAGDLFESLSRRVDLILSLRNTQRAASLVALGLAAMTAAGLTALAVPDARRAAGADSRWRRLIGVTPDLPARGRRALRRTERADAPRWLGVGRPAAAASLGVLLLAAAALPAQWRAGLIAERFDRPEDLPQAWHDVADHLAGGSGRVLEIPGIDFAAYRWGYALDPVSVGLTDRTLITRELVPTGGAAGVDVLEALDRSMQEGWFEAAALAPVARLLGASDVLVRNDLDYERHHTVRPRVLWPSLAGAEDLGDPARFGGPFDNRASSDLPMVDEVEVALDPDAPTPPQLAVFPVPDGARRALSTRPVDGATVLDGDGEGVVAAAAAGLLGELEGPLLLGADLTRADGRIDDALGAGARFVLTDTNRKRAKRWYTLYENAGATEPTEHAVVLDDDADARLEIAGEPVPGAQSVVQWRGAERIWATAYGAPATLLPEERPANAFDRDPRTAWRSEREPDGSRRAIGIDLGRPVDSDHIRLVPASRFGSVAVTRARVTLDGDRTIEVVLSKEEARDPAGARVDLDGEPFSMLSVQILDTVPAIGRGGFAEVAIPGVAIDEVVALPTALIDALGERLVEAPVAIVLSRLRADPADVLRDDPEPSMARALDLPVPLAVTPSGTARLDPQAPEALLDALLGAGPERWPARATSSARLQGDVDARASSAFDDDPTTAWQTPFEAVAGQWIELSLDQPTIAGSISLDIRADAHHSTPTAIELSVDGGAPVMLPIPEVAPGDLGTTGSVDLALPEPMGGRTWRFSLAGVEPRQTTDWYTGFAETLPVAISQIALPGVPVRPVADVDTGCRDDLLHVDGQPVPLRITGSAAGAAERDGLAIAACAGPLTLPAGAVDLRTAPGIDSALDIDRLVLRTASWDEPPAAVEPAPRATVTSEEPGRVSGRVQSDGEPFWLILDESVNPGWELSIEDAAVDGPRPIDAYAAGWLIDPDRAGTLDVTARFAPQRAVDLALVASAIAALVCVILVLVGRRRQPTAAPEASATALGWAGVDDRDVAGTPPSWSGVLLVAVAAAVLVQPVWGLAAGAIALAARLWPVVGRLAPAALVTLSAAMVVLEQVRHDHPAAFAWPTEFLLAHRIAMLAAVVLLVLSIDTRGGHTAATGGVRRPHR